MFWSWQYSNRFLNTNIYYDAKGHFFKRYQSFKKPRAYLTSITILRNSFTVYKLV